MLSVAKAATPYLVSAFLAIFLISVLIPLSHKIGLVDHPTERKTHKGSVPLIGGIAIAISLALSILLFEHSFRDLRILFLCIGVLTIIGALDDQRELRPNMRFYAQILVAILLTTIGNTVIIHVGDIFTLNRIIGLSFFSIPFSIIAIIGTINAFNMIDGHDGLAGVISLLSLFGLTALYCFRATPNDEQYLVILLLLITLITVFLFFNLGLVSSNKRIFLGDAGSMLIGLVMVFLLVRFSQRDIPIISPAAAAWIIGLPLLDMVSVMIIRLLSRASILNADRNHIHHLLGRFGLSNVTILISLSALHFLFVAIGVSGTLLEWPDAVLFWGMFPVAAFPLILSSLKR